MALAIRPDMLTAEPPQEFIDLIADWFCGTFADPYRNPRMAKSLGLYRLAASAPSSGTIVELGAYHGNGAVSLAAGAGGKRIVFTIDDFDHHVDWVGNNPGRADKALLLLNIQESRLPISWIDRSTEEMAKIWWQPIALLFWDTGSDSLVDDFEVWSKHLVSGGMFVMHDTDERQFHSDEVTRLAVERGWSVGPEYRTLYTVVKP